MSRSAFRSTALSFATLLVCMVVTSGCSGKSKLDTAVRDRCEAKWGVGNCVERNSKWVPLASATSTSTSTSTTAAATTTQASTTTAPPATTTVTMPPHGPEEEVVAGRGGWGPDSFQSDTEWTSYVAEILNLYGAEAYAPDPTSDLNIFDIYIEACASMKPPTRFDRTAGVLRQITTETADMRVFVLALPQAQVDQTTAFFGREDFASCEAAIDGRLTRRISTPAEAPVTWIGWRTDPYPGIDQVHLITAGRGMAIVVIASRDGSDTTADPKVGEVLNQLLVAVPNVPWEED